MSLYTCGCGHDGRLGLGNEANRSIFTPIPDFCNPEVNPDAPLTRRPYLGEVKHVFSGGFHTFGLTEDGTVYGFGLNEYGQLGMSTKTIHFKRPTKVDFFDRFDMSLFGCVQREKETDTIKQDNVKSPSVFNSSTASPVDANEEKIFKSVIRDSEQDNVSIRKTPDNLSSSSSQEKPKLIGIYCGAYHTVVWSSEGLYSCGRNNHGQLGLGHFDDQTSFCEVSSIQFEGSKFDDHVVGVSCGSFHTGIVVRCFRPVSANCGDAEKNDENDTVYRFAILTCGKGDFGELGYDADEWDKMSTMEKRLKGHLSQRAHYIQQGGNGDSFPEFSMSGQGIQNTSGYIGNEPKNSFLRVKHISKVKRRHEFSSHSLKKMKFPFLDHFTAPASVVMGPNYPPLQSDRCPIKSVKLKCLHHQTSVEITLFPAKEETVHMGSESQGCTLVYHFGCLYCNQIETIDTSSPRLLVPYLSDEGTLQDDACPDAAQKSKVDQCPLGNLPEIVAGYELHNDIPIQKTFRYPVPKELLDKLYPDHSIGLSKTSRSHLSTKFIHAGDEILFVVRGSTAARPYEVGDDYVTVYGKGNLGCGDDDDFAEGAEGGKLLKFPPPKLGDNIRTIVESIQGKDHFFFTMHYFNLKLNSDSTTEWISVGRCVYVFGDNFMGQCGIGLDEESTILSPTNITEIINRKASVRSETTLGVDSGLKYENVGDQEIKGKKSESDLSIQGDAKGKIIESEDAVEVSKRVDHVKKRDTTYKMLDVYNTDTTGQFQLSTGFRHSVLHYR